MILMIKSDDNDDIGYENINCSIFFFYGILAQSKEAKKGQAKAFSFSGITAKRGQKKEHKGKKKPGFENGKKGSQVLDRKPVKKQRFKKQASVKKQSSKNMNRKSKTSKGNLKQSF